MNYTVYHNNWLWDQHHKIWFWLESPGKFWKSTYKIVHSPAFREHLSRFFILKGCQCYLTVWGLLAQVYFHIYIRTIMASLIFHFERLSMLFDCLRTIGRSMGWGRGCHPWTILKIYLQNSAFFYALSTFWLPFSK